MTIRDRVLGYIREHPEGVTDSQITIALELKQHMQANSRCNSLFEEGYIERRKVNGIFHNFPKNGNAEIAASAVDIVDTDTEERAWCWEGNVQDAIIAFLGSQGYTIVRFSDTSTKERGKDIEAEKNGKRLWVTVKGYPKGTERTSPSTQAGHWFKQALYDIIAWRGEDPDADLALALPDFPRYRTLAEKVAWLQPTARFIFLWVRENASVSCVSASLP